MTESGIILDIAFIGLVALIAIVFGVLYVSYGRIWLRSLSSGFFVPFPEMLKMRLRGLPPALIVEAYILLNKTGVPITTGDLEALYLEHPDRIRTSSDLVALVTKDLRRMSTEA